MNETIKPNEPKFIMLDDFAFYCFGNCDLCKIRFNCWAGILDSSILNDDVWQNQTITTYVDHDLELRAFGDVRGRIIQYAMVQEGGRFYRIKYHGKQHETFFFKNSELLYLNDKGMVCCKKRAKPIHHIKGWK